MELIHKQSRKEANKVNESNDLDSQYSQNDPNLLTENSN